LWGGEQLLISCQEERIAFFFLRLAAQKKALPLFTLTLSKHPNKPHCKIIFSLFANIYLEIGN